MTELDHTSFDTLVADLGLLVGDGAMGYKPRLFRFVYYYDHPPSMPWFPLKMERVQFSTCDGILIKFAYGSMDSGSWITTLQNTRTFMLRDGYLYLHNEDLNYRYRRIALVDGSPVPVDDSLNDQLNKNLRGVFT